MLIFEICENLYESMQLDLEIKSRTQEKKRTRYILEYHLKIGDIKAVSQLYLTKTGKKQNNKRSF